MNSDLYLVVGVICAVLALPSLMGAFSEGRAPRAAAILVMIAGGLIVLAVYNTPSGITINDIPGAFARVFGKLLN